MPVNYKPLLEGIARFIGKGAEAVSHTDVERWIGKLSAPEKQVPVLHDYLRGASAIREAATTGATHVRDIEVPVWQSMQDDLETVVQADPEIQASLKSLLVNRKTVPDPDVTSTIVKPRTERQADMGGAPGPAPVALPSQNVRRPGQPANFGRMVSTEVSADVPTMPQAKAPRALPKLDETAAKQRANAWNEFAIGTEAQDPVRIESALERIRSLHEPETLGQSDPGWQRALNYMRSLEQNVEQWHQQGIKNDAWSRSLQKFHDQSGIDAIALPSYARDTVTRFEAWADAQKPPTARDRAAEVLGVPRSVMSSMDFSAPGRQGILMMSRPEYWQHMETMFKSWSPEAYLESQRYLRSHPDFDIARKAGLALTDINSKLAPREEAFRSKLAERIPGVKRSEQAYTTFLNRVRFDVFSNTLREAVAAGVDVKDAKFIADLAEWVNTYTGRGGGKDVNFGALSTILFSPRLAWARVQTLNPGYYIQMHPFVRQQALKTMFSSSAAIATLIGLAGAAGAKVTWDFRNPDAGKVRIGDTRLDLGGGLFQYIRLATQIATNESVSPETGKVTELGARFGSPDALDKVTQFVISKEAPVASLVTDMIRRKTITGEPFSLPKGVAERMIPLAMQDVYDALKDKGVQGLIYSIPAGFGIGVQTYKSRAKTETVPFLGVKGQVPAGDAKEYADMIAEADKRAAVMAYERSRSLKSPAAQKAVLTSYIKAERMKVRQAWIKANVDAFRQAKRAGEPTVPLVTPTEGTP